MHPSRLPVILSGDHVRARDASSSRRNPSGWRGDCPRALCRYHPPGPCSGGSSIQLMPPFSSAPTLDFLLPLDCCLDVISLLIVDEVGCFISFCETSSHTQSMLTGSAL